MKVKILFDTGYRILATMEANECPAEEFLIENQTYHSARNGLVVMLGHVADKGLIGVSPKWFHEASKRDKVYEFTKGDLRLFFFKGNGRDIAVCVSGVIKKGKKADKQSVARAASERSAYLAAIQSNSLEIIDDEQDQ